VISTAPAAAFLRNGLGERTPEVAIVLGSGLSGLATEVENPSAVPYREIPDFPRATVAGHQGALIFGNIGGTDVLLQSGRFHLYEGHSPEEVVLPVRVFAELGIRYLIVTNAAGGINRSFEPPALMLIADQINYMFRNPLVGPVVGNEQRFPDMSAPYDPELRDVARRVALDAGITLREGVYAGVLGPSYETPAEIRVLERLGADAVGMSTVPEVVAARARGVRVLGISTITNKAAGLSAQPLAHEEVLEAGRAVRDLLSTLVRGVLRLLP
jgi:purine-nucleoside phosphorylase